MRRNFAVNDICLYRWSVAAARLLHQMQETKIHHKAGHRHALRRTPQGVGDGVAPQSSLKWGFQRLLFKKSIGTVF